MGTLQIKSNFLYPYFARKNVVKIIIIYITYDLIEKINKDWKVLSLLSVEIMNFNIKGIQNSITYDISYG